jgi:hypothetical protein
LKSAVRYVNGKRERPLSKSKGILLHDVEKAFNSVWHEALPHKPLEGAVTSLWLNQSSFRQHHSCTEKVMALTTLSKAGFQNQLKTGAVFIDLTAAYDTVWREGLMIKFLETVPCLKLFNLLNNMLSNHYFQVSIGDQSSRWRRLNNGLLQGSVSHQYFSTFICRIYHLLLRRCSNTRMTLL